MQHWRLRQRRSHILARHTTILFFFFGCVCGVEVSTPSLVHVHLVEYNRKVNNMFSIEFTYRNYLLVGIELLCAFSLFYVINSVKCVFISRSVTSNRLRWINETDLPRNLQTIDFRANPLSIIMLKALRGMTRLRKLWVTTTANLLQLSIYVSVSTYSINLLLFLCNCIRILSDVRSLKVFPDLEGCFSLEVIKLDRAGIKEVPANLCRQTPRLKSL